MAEEKEVAVKLAGGCYVNKQLREAGEIVMLPKSIADSFGEVLKGSDAQKAKETAEGKGE